MLNILVLCTGNSARSILLEGILGDLGYNTFSAGSKPVGKVNPVALDTLAHHSITIRDPRSKSWDEFAAPDAPLLDLIITVCGNAAGETCPIWPSKPNVVQARTHWGVDDPAGAANEPQAFETAFQILNRRAQAFHVLSDKRSAKALAKIGSLP